MPYENKLHRDLFWKIVMPGAGKISQWLLAFVALLEDKGSILSTKMVAHNHF